MYSLPITVRRPYRTRAADQRRGRRRLGTPKSGKAREIALSNDTVAALKAHRHLRGPLVFCTMDGGMLKYTELRHPLWRACRKAGLRPVQWHVCRPLVRESPRDAWRAAQGGAGAAGSQHDPDDDALRPPRSAGHPGRG